MNKSIIVVPKGVKFIGRDWIDGDNRYDLKNYPFPHIVNKVLTGCGYTEYCLRNDQDLVLISPRKFLLENKLSQHLKDLNIHYAENRTDIITNYERDISGEDKAYLSKINKIDTNVIKERKRESVETLKRKVREHIISCRRMGKPVKIMVTYDSFRHVKEAIRSLSEETLQNFQIVVDEFQSIFIDARFKSDAELELLNNLQDLQKICFVSATPYLDKYLEMLDEFNNIPYYEFDWKTEDPSRVTNPKLVVNFVLKSLNFYISKVIQEYLSGDYETRVRKDKSGVITKYISNEAVFFLNSVKGICKAITTNNLNIEQCNILCAKTDDNNKQIRDAFNLVIKRKAEQSGIKNPELLSGNVIGYIPGYGEPHKMFTFCTRTVYLGADFYSTNARTFIFSDANIECLSVDISMDLEQILGRQRREDNIWKNIATMYVKTTRESQKRSLGDFIDYVKGKEEKSYSLLRSYDNADQIDKHNLAEAYQTLAAVHHYKDNYVAVNKHAGKDLVPVFNKLMLVSEIRAFEIQQVDYAERFTVISNIETNELAGEINNNIKEEVKKFSKIKNTEDKFKFIVGLEERLTKDEIDLFFNYINNYTYKDYYELLGFSGIKAHKYKEAEIKREAERIRSNSNIEDKIKDEIYRLFTVGYRYSKSDIKSTLKNAYERVGYQKTAKASDLEEYFIVKDTKLQNDTKKWVNGFEIIGKK
jgi:hypothetical protein